MRARMVVDVLAWLPVWVAMKSPLLLLLLFVVFVQVVVVVFSIRAWKGSGAPRRLIE